MKLRRLLSIGAAIWLGSVIFALIATLPSRAPGAAAAAARDLSWAGDSRGLDTIELRAQSGTVRVLASADDSVRVRMTVRADDSVPHSLFARPRPADLSRAALQSDREHQALRLELEGASYGRRVEEWAVEVPVRLATRISLGNGQVEVKGVGGGVYVRANAGRQSQPGRVTVDVPGGSVDASLSVGTVVVRTATQSYNDVSVRSGVGDAHLWLEGHRVVHADAPGPGSQVALQGEGRDKITAHVGVGDAEVRIR
jgi:hypothetical protein